MIGHDHLSDVLGASTQRVLRALLAVISHAFEMHPWPEIAGDNPAWNKVAGAKTTQLPLRLAASRLSESRDWGPNVPRDFHRESGPARACPKVPWTSPRPGLPDDVGR